MNIIRINDDVCCNVTNQNSLGKEWSERMRRWETAYGMFFDIELR